MSDDNEIIKAHTCGLCEALCSKAMVSEHECLQGYNQLWINPQTLYFYPLLDDNTHIIVKDSESEDGIEKRIPFRDLLNDTNSPQSEPRKNLKRKISNDESQHISKKSNGWRQDPRPFSYDDEEALIHAVREREPLWNNRLPIQERSTGVRFKLWQEISDLLGGKVSPEGIKSKFKNLWDSYRRIIQAETQSDGGSSARKENKRRWHHYDSMDFFRDSVKETTSNTKKSIDSQLDDNSCDMGISQNIPAVSRVKSRRNMDANTTNFNINKKSSGMKQNPRCSVFGEEEVMASDIREQDAFWNQRMPLEDPFNAHSTALDRIADAFCYSQMNERPLPPMPQRDEIDSILFVIGCRVRKLPRKIAMDFLNKCFTESYALEIAAEED